MSMGRRRRLAEAATLTAALLALLAVAEADRAEAAFPGPNGHIYFHTERNDDTVIARVNANGKGFKALTPERLDAEDVAVSPNGKRIAFECEPTAAEQSEICVANRNGKQRRVITNHPGANDSDPAWSPNGKWIAFESDRDGDDEIFKMRANGTRLRKLTDNGVRDEDPVWSTRGLIAWEADVAAPEIGDIFVMRANGNRKRNLTESPLDDDADPDFSPNGKRIAFDSEPAASDNDDIWVMRANGKQKRKLTSHAADDEDPSFSPDGKLIAFMSERGGSDDIFRMRANGNNERRVVARAADDNAPDWSRKPRKKRKRR